MIPPLGSSSLYVNSPLEQLKTKTEVNIQRTEFYLDLYQERCSNLSVLTSFCYLHILVKHVLAR